MAFKGPFTEAHRAKLSAAAKARVARLGVPKDGFKGHKHTRASKAKMAAAAKARWEAHWDAEQAKEDAEALSEGRPPVDVRSCYRRDRNPNPKPRVKVDPDVWAAAEATRLEAARKAKEQREADAAFWAQQGEIK